MKWSNVILLTSVALLAGALLSAHSRVESLELNRITEQHLNPVVTPWVDEKYGCEYLVSDKGGVTPRIGSECREFLPQVAEVLE